jgi:hypothetical protein
MTISLFRGHFAAFRWWFFGLLCVVLTSCTGEPTDSSTAADPATTAEEAEEEQAYFHLKGELAGEAVTFDLLLEDNAAYPEQGYFRGFYRYDRFGEPIALYGSKDSSGYLVLTEQGGYDQESHSLKGQWSEAGYAGRWFNGSGKQDYAFNLRTVDTGYIDLQYQELVDSVVAFPAWKFSPQASFRAQWLRPRAADTAQRNFVARAIAAGFENRKLTDNGSTVERAVEAAKNIFFEDYRREMLSLYRDGLLDSTNQDRQMPFSYLYEKSVIVYFNSDELLTLGFTDYSYTGGAHGIYATEVKSYDLASQREIVLADVLRPGYERSLSEVLARVLRVKYQLDANAPLSEVLFEDKLEPNENFGLTDKGIFFVYQPYEIAAYALGEIELFIPFDRIAEYVREEWWSTETEPAGEEGEE